MGQRQFKIGWSHNDSVIDGTSGYSDLVSAPEDGKVRVVEIVRYRVVGITNPTLWQIAIDDGSQVRAVYGRSLGLGTINDIARGPFVLLPGQKLVAAPVLVTATTGDFSADWVER